MSKSVLLIFCLIFIFLSCNKPTPAKNTAEGKTMPEILAQKYPQAQDVIWDTLENERIASFFDGKNDNAVYFDSLGKFQQRIIFIEPQDLPKPILEWLYKNYKPRDLALVQKIENIQKTSYHIEFETNTDYIILNYDAQGNLLNEKKDPLSMEELRQQEEEGVEDDDN